MAVMEASFLGRASTSQLLSDKELLVQLCGPLSQKESCLSRWANRFTEQISFQKLPEVNSGGLYWFIVLSFSIRISWSKQWSLADTGGLGSLLRVRLCGYR